MTPKHFRLGHHALGEWLRQMESLEPKLPDPWIDTDLKYVKELMEYLIDAQKKPR